MPLSTERISVAPPAPQSQSVAEVDGPSSCLSLRCVGRSRNAPALLEDLRDSSQSGVLPILPKPADEWPVLAESFEDHPLLGCGLQLQPHLAACINAMRRSVFREGSILQQAGSYDPPPQLFIILRGYCEAVECDDDRRREVLGPGMHFGEPDLLRGTAPTRTIRVLKHEPLIACHLDRHTWRRIAVQLRLGALRPTRLLSDTFPSLQLLTHKEVADLAPAMQRRVFLKEEVVWRRGQQVDTLLLVVAGALHTLSPGGTGPCVCPAGQWVGGPELLTDQRAAATLQAAEDTLCLALAQRDVGRLPPLLRRRLEEAVATPDEPHGSQDRHPQSPSGFAYSIASYKFGSGGDDKADALEAPELPPSAARFKRRRCAVWDDQLADGALPPRREFPRSKCEASVLQQFLATHPLFRHLDGADRRQLVEAMEERRYCAGAVIGGPMAGEDGDAFFVVMEGKCGLFPGNGTFETVERCGSFGGDCLLLPGPSALVARALTDVRTMRLDRTTYRSSLRVIAQRQAAEFASLLTSVPFVRPMSAAARLALLGRARMQRWMPGDWVVRDGASASCIVLLAEGEVHCSGPEAGDTRSTAGPITDCHMLLGPRSNVDIVVLQSTRTWTVAKADLEDVLGDSSAWLAKAANPLLLSVGAPRAGSPPRRRPRGKSPYGRPRSPWPIRPPVHHKKKVVAHRVRRRSPYPAAGTRCPCPSAPHRTLVRPGRQPSPPPALRPRLSSHFTEELLCPLVPAVTLSSSDGKQRLPLTRPMRSLRCQRLPQDVCVLQMPPAHRRQWLQQTFQQQALFGLGERDAKVVEALVQRMPEVTLACGQEVMRGGSAAVHEDDVMYVILEGQCTVLVDGKVVTIVGAGECIGELEFLHRLPMKCSAVVATPILKAFALQRAAYATVVRGE